ncbi:hypothetical protein GCM10020216_060970 [Nonomuraea helvata]
MAVGGWFGRVVGGWDEGGERDSGETWRLPTGTVGRWHTIVLFRLASVVIFWRETFMVGAPGQAPQDAKPL